MKKISLIVFSVLSGLTAWGQANTSTVSQTGVNQSVTVDQQGTGLTSTILQVGTPTSNSGNVGLVYQTGTGHSSTIDQTRSNYNRAGVTQAGTGPGSNTSVVEQNGNANGSSGGVRLRSADPAVSAPGDGNWAGVWQLGSSNNARIRQNSRGGATTDQNFGEIWQQGNQNIGDIQQTRGRNNRAEIFQGNEQRGGGPPAGNLPSANVSGNFADIDQERGISNRSVIRQFSNSNRGEVNQNIETSRFNIANIQQGDGTNLSGQAENEATIEQNNISENNQAYILQLGFDGRAEINQDGVGSSGGSKTNVASITQTTGSEDNRGRIDQSSGNSLFSERNTASILQQGEDARAHIRQAVGTKDSKATIVQGTGGDRDLAYIWQGSSTSSTASISQNLTATGTDNIASIQQGVNLASPGTSLSATIVQEGSRNDARLLQVGTGSSASVVQTGNNNVVTGPGVGVAVGSGEGGLIGGSYAEQRGTNHRMSITQTSPNGTNSTIFNTADVQQLGSGNVLVGTQIADTVGNLMTVRQNGNMNQAFIQQNGVTATP